MLCLQRVTAELERKMGYVDVHTHVLPGLDDGAQDMRQSLEMLRIAAAEGITDIIATPHYKRGRFRGDRKEINKKLELLREAAGNEGLQISIYPGTEIYYHSELEGKLERGEICTLNHTDHVLVEFSPFENYSYIRNAAEDILSMGYCPVLAHVERYQCLLKDVDKVRELKEMGCDIQVNAASVVGNGGFAVKRFIRKILKQELADYVGTDAHNTEGRKPAMKKCAEILCRKYGSKYAEAVLEGNARSRLLGGCGEEL